MIKEQYLATCEPQLSIHVREREINGIAEVAKAADRFLDARRYTNFSDKSKQVKSGVGARPTGDTH